MLFMPRASVYRCSARALPLSHRAFLLRDFPPFLLLRPVVQASPAPPPLICPSFSHRGLHTLVISHISIYAEPHAKAAELPRTPLWPLHAISKTTSIEQASLFLFPVSVSLCFSFVSSCSSDPFIGFDYSHTPRWLLVPPCAPVHSP